MTSTTWKLTIAVAICASTLGAQTAASLVAESKAAYASVKVNVLKGAENMPEDGYAFQPTPEIRTFGALMGHIADAQMRTCSAVNGEMKPATAAKMTAKADLVAALKAAIAECDAAFEGTTDANAMSMIKMRNTERTRIGTLIYNTTHVSEEYGYMAVYLRLKGVVPPSSAK